MNEIEDLVGDQTPVSGDAMWLNWSVLSGTSHVILRRPIATATAFSSLDAMFSDFTLIPPCTGDNEQRLNVLIARDVGRGFGKKFGNVLAYVGPRIEDKPIAMIKSADGTIRYYASPVIADMIKRL